jgi:hypothetical protein
MGGLMDISDKELAWRFRLMARRMATMIVWPHEDTFQRAGGGVECTVCGLPFYDHPEKDHLVLTCEGKLVKL